MDAFLENVADCRNRPDCLVLVCAADQVRVTQRTGVTKLVTLLGKQFAGEVFEKSPSTAASVVLENKGMGCKPMRVVHVITCLLNGGSEENTIATCNAQVDRGHDVWILYGQDVDEARRATISDKVEVKQIPDLVRNLDPFRDLKALFDIGTAIRKIKPMVLHTHASKAGIIGRLAAFKSGIPIVLHGVHILPFVNVSTTKKIFYLALEKLVAPRTDAYIAVSRGMKFANLGAGLGSAENNFVVYSGMEIERFKSATPIKHRPEGRILTMVASLEPRKRHVEFVEVFERLVRRHSDLNLYVIGQGECEAEIKEKIKEIGIDSKVYFEGFKTNVEQYIASADVCVLASNREGLPRAAVQYVAAGKPVVLTSLPGIEEIVKDGVNGIIVHSENVADMEVALNNLLTNEAMLEEMAGNALQFDVSNWSMGAMEPKIEAIIRGQAKLKGIHIDVHADPALDQFKVDASK